MCVIISRFTRNFGDEFSNINVEVISSISDLNNQFLSMSDDRKTRVQFYRLISIKNIIALMNCCFWKYILMIYLTFNMNRIFMPP